MQIGERRERRRWKKIKLAARLQHMRESKALHLDQNNLMPEEKRAEKSVEPKQRSASGVYSLEMIANMSK